MLQLHTVHRAVPNGRSGRDADHLLRPARHPIPRAVLLPHAQRTQHRIRLLQRVLGAAAAVAARPVPAVHAHAAAAGQGTRRQAQDAVKRAREVK